VTLNKNQVGDKPVTQVIIDTGIVEGAQVESRRGIPVMFFGGIPYAAPPVGPLRWREPHPVKPWEGVRDATAYASSAPQIVRGKGSFRDIIAQALNYEPANPRVFEYDEDCLYLNVFTPSLVTEKKLPVMFWVHGGAHRNGTGSAYPGQELAERGVVLVTINYRLGPLGFMSHPELTAEGCRGNQGLLDTLYALQWVQRNIAHFGGDKDNVTVFGESAGGHSTIAMFTSPLSQGLIHRAIAQSGVGAHAVQLLDKPGAIPISAHDTGETLGAFLGCKTGIGQLDAMRQLSADEIIQKTATLPIPGVIIDGYCQVKNPMTIIREGRHNDMPLMIGSNAYEGSALYWGSPMPQMTLCQDVETYLAEFQRFFGEDYDEAIKLYPASDQTEMVLSSKEMCGDSLFCAPTRAVAQALADQGKTCFPYYFTQTPEGDTEGKLGAFHAMEIGYVFGSDFLSPLSRDSDRKLSDMMMRYWINFATNGNPNGEGLPKWSEFNSNADQWLELNDSVGMKPIASASKYNVVMKGIDRHIAQAAQ
jgi:para-nitrobenzyl esterase